MVPTGQPVIADAHCGSSPVTNSVSMPSL
jgi:hypothetical protein